MIKFLRRWYFRVFPHYRWLDFLSATYSEAQRMLKLSEGLPESER